MEKENWDSVREDLGRLFDNSARVFTDAALNKLAQIVRSTDKKSAAILASIFLKNSPLEGELLQIYGGKISSLIGEPVDIDPRPYLPIHERSAWVTNPESGTFEKQY